MTDTIDEDYFGQLVDEKALYQRIADVLGETDHYTIRRHSEGHSNETLFVKWGDRELVVRRPPPGDIADDAHQVLREYTVMSALQESPVPVPETFLSCSDEHIIGSEFYVMEKLEGDVIRHDEPKRFAEPTPRETVGHELVDTLAAIHTVDYEDVGLTDFGMPTGFVERQVSIWTKQLEWAFDRTTEIREIPELERVGDWLEDNVPSKSHHSIVHGDYKLDNVMFAPGMLPRINGILDWEMSTIGDPLTDLGYFLIYWREANDPPSAVPDIISSVPEKSGYPSRSELVKRYEDRSGIEFKHDVFYRTLALYKLAALCEMFFRRHLDGSSDDSLYPKMQEQVPDIADRAIRVIGGEERL